MNLIDPSCKHWLESIKHKIKVAQLMAAVRVGFQMLEMYGQLAEEIVSKQKNAHWGEVALEQLSVDLKLSFQNINGFLEEICIPGGSVIFFTAQSMPLCDSLWHKYPGDTTG